MSTTTHILVETGIDYLSMSLNRKVKDYATWFNEATRIISIIGDRGNLLRYGTFQGYEGWYCAGCFVGDRDDGAHIHLPGSYADLFFLMLFHAEAHYSRLDIQSTVRFEPFDINLAEQEEKHANEANELLPDNRQRNIRVVRDNKGGRTLYIGERTSPVYTRLYNKEAKSTDERYTGCWRYEIELHNDIASRVAMRLSANSGSIYPMCASLVWQTFKDRGIEPPYTKTQEGTALPPSSYPQSDVDKKLRWFREQVQPTVKKLLNLVDRDIVMEALGMADELPVEP